jgi:hypothetical protein
MRFVNFDLESPNDTIELRGLGLNWDLHNFADFSGMRLEPDGPLVLSWVAPDHPNPWGDTNNRYRGCELRFSGLRRLEVTGRDAAVLGSEDRTLHSISKVAPGDGAGEYRKRREWVPEAAFHLLLTLTSGLSIEVDADEAELRALHFEAAA